MAQDRKKKRLPLWAAVLIGFIKIIWIPVACLAMLYIGLYIGYVKLGDQSAADIMHVSTWKHLYDLVFASK